MAPSSSASTPRPCVPPAFAYKMGEISPSDQSYFSTPSYSTIPVTPLAAPTPPSAQTPPIIHSAAEHFSSSEPEMLHRLAMCFPPPPPTLSLRQSTSDSLSPQITTYHRLTTSPESVPPPVDRSRRSPSPSYPIMDISSSLHKYTLHVQLPPSIQPEMITISANRGDKLKVVADAWHGESDCHYEWQIAFSPRDIDMTAIHAKFEPNGHLYIDIRRIGWGSH